MTIDSLLWRYGATNEDVHFLAAEEMKPFRAVAAAVSEDTGFGEFQCLRVEVRGGCRLFNVE